MRGIQIISSCRQLIDQGQGSVREMSLLRLNTLYRNNANRAQGLIVGSRMVLRNSNNRHLELSLCLGTLLYLSDLIRALTMAATRRCASNRFIGCRGFSILCGMIGITFRGTCNFCYLLCIIRGNCILTIRGIFRIGVYLYLYGAKFYRHYNFYLFIGCRITILKGLLLNILL